MDPLPESEEPIASPNDGNLVRPVWIVAWISIAIGAMVLVPTQLPVYGAELPGWILVVPPIEAVVLLGLTLGAVRRRRRRAHQWLIATLTGPAIAGFFAAGVVLLVRDRWNPLAVGALGALFLIVLTVGEASAVTMDAKQAPFRAWLP